jgi:hypothetical protein
VVTILALTAGYRPARLPDFGTSLTPYNNLAYVSSCTAVAEQKNLQVCK